MALVNYTHLLAYQKLLEKTEKLTIFCHLTKRNITLNMTAEDGEMALNML